MTRHVYIDAYNVLHKIPHLARLLRSNADAARRGLVEIVSAHRVPGATMHVVFDAFGEPIGGGAGVTVVFAMTRTADGWIRMRIENDPAPRASLVVSSDHEVLAHAAAMGAATLSSERFLGSRATGAAPSGEEAKRRGRLPQSEIDEWMSLFTRGEE